MTILASFSYDGPATPALFFGLLAATVVLIGLWFSRSIVAGAVGGAASGAAIAWIVFGFGRGDMVHLMQGFGAVIFGVAGAIAGALAGFGGKIRRRNQARMKHGQNADL